MSKRNRFNNRELTNKLRELAAEIHDVELIDGEAVTKTRGETLAELIWKRALGYTEEVTEEDPDTPGKVNTRMIIHKPEISSAHLIYDRLEGKTPQALPDEHGGVTAADKVRELAIARVNRMANEAIGQKMPGPPSYKRKDKDGDIT